MTVYSKVNGSWIKVADSTTDILQLAYPVGSIYINASNSTNPATLFGFGTWQQIGEGNVLLAGTTNGTYKVGTSYGSNTTDKVAAHTHTFSTSGDTDGSHGHSTASVQGPGGRAAVALGNPDGWSDYDTSSDRGYVTTTTNRQDAGSKLNYGLYVTSDGSVHHHSGTTASSGDASVSIMQQSIAVYMWKRTA